MRRITDIVIHCSATSQSATVSAIVNYWRNTLKWSNPGYHKIIDKDGCVSVLAGDERVCNGVAGHNSTSLHVCYIGGVDANNKALDNRTDAQKEKLLEIILEWKSKYPSARIRGHRDYPNVRKACPSFDCMAEYADI